ncbi:MAG: hypothetical protein EPO09_19570 [Aquabacterium sp.]|uniref:hypothetical protein n=1 Tax=Aquabacterium sp. TaxID=1872578 RepID=UPI0011F9D795|nr:hypothetical protein [Aquabacterium sp.]TAK86581.1 MAG: hypothetical protein EPO09_19570 [Aquabacterium sp.]
MNHQRRAIVAWGVLQLALSGAGCSSTPPLTRQTYTEKVSVVMITRDKQQFVILGERYHYIFAAPEELVALLSSSLKAQASAVFDPFFVKLDGQTRGKYHLRLPASLKRAEAEDAKAMAFVQQPDGSWLLEGELRGKRFIQGSNLFAGRVHANLAKNETLPHTHIVTVEAEESVGEKAAQDAATPLAVTADGVWMLYFVVLVPVILPLMFLAREKKPGELPPLASSTPPSAPAPASAASAP